jgi:histidinol-phosphatase (PHP family)
VLVDYHIHTPYCGHAQGKTIQYIETAIALGFDEICFSDHLGRYYLTHVQRRRYWDWGMNERNITRYIKELAELRDMYRDRINIKIGLEIDFIEGAEELLQPFLDHYAFDFLLGSIHCLPRYGWKHLADYSSYNETEVITEYFRCARAALASRKFQSLAHLDFIWRYLRWPQADGAQFFAREIADTVTTARESGTCVEINANGFLWSQMNSPPGGPDPFMLLLDELRKQNVPVTIGSDAHDPLLVGKSFGDLIPALHSHGIFNCTTFTEGKPKIVPFG